MKKVLVSSMLILGGLFSACSGFLDEDPKSKKLIKVRNWCM